MRSERKLWRKEGEDIAEESLWVRSLGLWDSGDREVGLRRVTAGGGHVVVSYDLRRPCGGLIGVPLLLFVIEGHEGDQPDSGSLWKVGYDRILTRAFPVNWAAEGRIQCSVIQLRSSDLFIFRLPTGVIGKARRYRQVPDLSPSAWAPHS